MAAGSWQNATGVQPATPASGFVATWHDANGVPHLLDSSGNDVYLTGNKGTAIVITGTSQTLTPPVLSDYVQVSFNTPATDSISTIAATYIGKHITLEFTTMGTLVNGANLVLPNGTNITAYNGLVLKFKQETSTLWRCIGRVDNSPSFRAYLTTSETINSGTEYVVGITNGYTKSWDTNSNFDAASGAGHQRFTPTIPGRYFLNVRIYISSSTIEQSSYIGIRKNGSAIMYGYSWIGASNTYTTAQSISASEIVTANGTTDYFDLVASQTNTGAASRTLTSGSTNTIFEGWRIGD